MTGLLQRNVHELVIMSGLDWKLEYRKQDAVRLGNLFQAVSCFSIDDGSAIAANVNRHLPNSAAGYSRPCNAEAVQK